MLRKSRRRNGRLTKAELTLTPLIDTALTLLIIFMITAPIMRNSIKITLPEGSAKEAGETKQDLIVYIDAKDQIFFNDVSMTLERLVPAIKEKVGPSKEQTVFVRADTAVQYGKVIKIVDQIKAVGGVDYVALATQNPAQA